ncbi:T9SS type A sorting domain-containing protein [Flavobacterium suzhouense]|uniref:T9SS type A sorting domain-containing protein n=1 Tax=Flavobacterium suzhouense TaxID=1529638 RepID=A0ABW5NR17_9FLAO
MKGISTFLLIFVFVAGYSQVTNEGKPFSWGFTQKSRIDKIIMPVFDIAKLREEDKINDADKKKAWRYGYEFLVDNNINNSGKWTVLPNGDRVWRIRYYSKGAKTLNFLFSDYYMPEGAKVYLYNDERTDLLGAYDAAQNNERRELGTWLVSGDDIWIEYYEPAAVKGLGKLEIFKIVHGYRSVATMKKSPDDDLNASGDCNYDVDCDMGNINSYKDINKKAVGLIIVNNSSFCTGTLINTTSSDGTPYLLTANHCAEGKNVSNWAFRFNWISPNPVCAENTNSTTNAPNYYQTVSGAELKAKSAASDFCLLKLTSQLPEAWDLVWAGWSRSTTPPSSAFGIHHPSGDIMKASKDNNAPSINNSDGLFMWVVNDWEMGVTESGSSGSALFDNNGRIIGQLYGGESGCNGTSDNGGYDIYGRFDISWNGGGTSATRLKDWLDPENTNALTINYRSSTDAPQKDIKFSVYPNPSSGIVTIDSPKVCDFALFNMVGQLIAHGQLVPGNNNIDISGLAEGVYPLVITESSGHTIEFKVAKY